MRRLLDLYSGAGGAGTGYARAGFDVTGVDIKAQPRYPFGFVQGDAIEFLLEHGREFDAIHASPPCQAYSMATRDHSLHPDLYAPTRAALLEIGRPFVIENVISAPYHHGIVLCGSMFPELEADGEWLRRHRNFETSWFMFQPQCEHRTDRRPVTITGQAFTTAMYETRHSRQAPFPMGQRLMGIDWMTRNEMVEAIPPPYTQWIGAQLMRVLELEEVACGE